MLDALSLDQLRTFIAAAEEGSFSAAARKMFRAQSAVSDLISKLESQIGVVLFDRSGRYPNSLPKDWRSLRMQKKIVASVDDLKARAKEMSAGLEPELAVVVDVFFPDGRDCRNSQRFPQSVSTRLASSAY